ncbi:hypothetical protein Pcar_1092 [Syntrophotalea carbinolica DSM 2380]|uniref:Uncharacterized protein n=1 Tax=Syntrophotalea carbinolica (strain DSM 2380 / NBRC 103641 / GraBd1) TaxID=338963 RepID=Q3A5L6_SYNC1|nr:hypothetical protein [Syntrophotalea carbinolica]ABA88341.1 hypothetical protein Pcar_1092 [Syntrophotalea carbinolica DSM 2380]
MTHIELNRKFWAVSDQEDPDPDALRYQHLWSRDSQPGWPELLKLPRVVILAEAGTGKTEEFRETAHRLHAEGKAAFFCAIEELAEIGIEEAFDVGTYSEFRAWRDTDQSGWFFLDSVDEARLVSHDRFKRALKRIARALNDVTHRAFIYISGRGSDWDAISDLSLVEEWLPVPKEKIFQKENETEGDKTPVLPDKDESTDTELKISIFRLAPLTWEQIQLFACHRGVHEPARFIEAIGRADAGIFAERPRDLIDLIAFWQEFGEIASLAEMTEYNIGKKLTETNPKHDKKSPLSPDKARAGAESIAAALTLSRCNFIALPDPKDPSIFSRHALDPKEVLVDWTSGDVESLLRRALFDEATYGRAKIHHRSVREYLTAQWLYNLLQQGKSRRCIEQLLFAERYGLNVVVPSMKPIVAWLALWDEKICQRLCNIAPEILIGYGDPSRLPIPVREKLLRQFAEVCVSNQYYDESLDLAAIRRLADTRLADTIIELLKKYQSNEEVRHLLLRTIWQGEIKECAEIALNLALDLSMDRYTRLGGIRAIGVCGAKEQQERLVLAILADTEKGDVDLISAVCEQFFPELITVDALLDTLAKIPKPKRFSTSPISYALEQAIEKGSEETLLPLLTGLIRLLELEPFVENFHCDISKRYAWLLPHAVEIANGFLRHPSLCLNDAVLRAAELNAQSRHYDEDSKADLQSAIDNMPDLRHVFFWRAVRRVRDNRKKKNERLDDWWFIKFEPAPWKVMPEDFTYFLAQAELLPDKDDQLVAYSVALSLWHNAGRDKLHLEEMKTLARRNVEMTAKLGSYLNPPSLSSEELECDRRRNEWRQEQNNKEREQKKNRQAWIQRLQSDPQQICDISGSTIASKFPDLYDLAANIREQKNQGGSKWGSDRWETLIEEFGLEVAEAARDGLMAYWRHFCPKLKSEQDANGIPNDLIVGMVGLAIEARMKPDWARCLSHEEALLAVRYAIHEINGFPPWIKDLLASQPQAIDEILQKEFLWEFGLNDGERSTPVHHMLAQLRYSRLKPLKDRYGPYIFQLLQNKEPRRDQTLENALSIVLQGDGLDGRALAELAQRRHIESEDESRLLTWLVAWLCVDAEGAQIALQQWLSKENGKDKRREKMIRFCGAMGHHHFSRFGSNYRDFERIESLEKFVPLIYQHIRIEDDNIHDGVFTPDARDNAEDMRGYLLGKVCDTPGHHAFETLLNFSKILPHKRSRERMLVIALRRAAADTELSPWEPSDVVAFAEDGEKRPATAGELFDLVCIRLDDIKYDLEEGDTSVAATLQRVDQETELRIWFSDSLRKAARGKYSIAPEEELADAKRPDIRVHAQEIDAPCVIELKISDNWSFNEHIERLQRQLVGQYLRDVRSRYGVFLLARRRQAYWVSGRRLTFEELIAKVQIEANRINQRRPDLEAIKVIGIDLAKRRG